MKPSFPPLADVLLECLHVSRPIDKNKLAGLSLADWDHLLRLSLEHGVMPLLYARLKAQDARPVVPALVWEQLAAQTKSAATWNLVLQREFNRVVTALAEAGIPVIALKGMHLASLVYANFSLRSMGDLDLLVPQADAFRAAQILQTLGYQLPHDLSMFELDLFLVNHHLPDLVKKGRFSVEIHAHVTHPNRTYTVDTQVWWDNAVTAQIAGVTVKVLDPVDLLLHLCIHLSYMHQFKTDLRHYYDLVAVIQFFGDKLDWTEVIQRAKARCWQRGIFLAFKMAEILFGLELPAEAVNGLSEGIETAPIESALAGMWLSGKDKGIFSRNVAEFQYKHGLMGKLSYIWQRIFIPKDVMARFYAVPKNSARLYFYYLVRVKYLFSTHTGRVWRMWRGDQSTVTKATDMHTLWAWLNKSE